MPATLDLSGRTFGYLFVIGYSHRRGAKRIHRCQCLCGNTAFVETGGLKSGKQVSCGCYNKEQRSKRVAERNTTHGLSGTRVYRIWFDMVRRCTRRNRPGFERYGGRGIRVCERWLKFENFFQDMKHPPGFQYSIERKNNNGDYEPSNCHWGILSEQANNRSNNHLIEYKGQSYTLAQASRRFNIKYALLRDRIKRGWDISRAIEHPPKK